MGSTDPYRARFDGKHHVRHVAHASGKGANSTLSSVTATLRANSTIWTGGVGNLIISAAELGGALLVSILALTAPAAAIALVLLFLWLAIRLLRRLLRGARPSTAKKPRSR
jgi:hypothetical protein